MALMELCDDLFERLHLYGHASYLDIRHAQETLREHWKTAPHETSYTTLAFDGAKGLLSAAASKAALKLSGLLNMVGIFGAIHSQIVKYFLGFTLAHPGVFIGSLVAAVILQVGSEKIEEVQLISEVEGICENLKVVTSNLRSHYTHASGTLAESFLSKDGGKVMEAVKVLLGGTSKDNTASLQRHFDKRDELFERL